MNVYWIGQSAQISAVFRVDGVLADPSEILVTALKPDGTTSEYRLSLGEVTRDSAGIYHVDVSADAAGMWHYRVDGDGVEAVSEGEFFVRKSEAL